MFAQRANSVAASCIITYIRTGVRYAGGRGTKVEYLLSQISCSQSLTNLAYKIKWSQWLCCVDMWISRKMP